MCGQPLDKEREGDDGLLLGCVLPTTPFLHLKVIIGININK